MKVLNIPFEQVPQFSSRDQAFTTESSDFSPFLSFPTGYDTLDKAIELKSTSEVNRALLHEVLTDQYRSIKSSDLTKQNIDSLKEADCYTVITAHQPSLLTGPAYYVYKILNTIAVARRYNKEHANNKIVPVFVIGSEDHDFEEINHLQLFGKSIHWNRESKGSVGELSCDGLDEVLDNVIDILGENSQILEILNGLKTRLSHCTNYGQFAFLLTHALFDHLGLVILRMSDSRLKNAFKQVIKKEVINSESKLLVTTTQQQIESSLGFSPQAYVRDINFFYCSEYGRNRIERREGGFEIVDTGLKFSEQEMSELIEKKPEKFSPNVIMRPIYQEFVLPNLAYIGGGGEIAYWTERKRQFDHFGIQFPMLVRRTSALMVTKSDSKLMQQLDLDINTIFQHEHILIKKLIENSDLKRPEMKKYVDKITQLFEGLAEEIGQTEPSLKKTTFAESAKVLKSLDYLSSKVDKAIKQKEATKLNRLKKLKQNLFPDGLQERKTSFLQFLSIYGLDILEDLLPYFDPFDKDFKAIMLH